MQATQGVVVAQEVDVRDFPQAASAGKLSSARKFKHVYIDGVVDLATDEFAHHFPELTLPDGVHMLVWRSVVLQLTSARPTWTLGGSGRSDTEAFACRPMFRAQPTLGPDGAVVFATDGSSGSDSITDLTRARPLALRFESMTHRSPLLGVRWGMRTPGSGALSFTPSVWAQRGAGTEKSPPELVPCSVVLAGNRARMSYAPLPRYDFFVACKWYDPATLEEGIVELDGRAVMRRDHVVAEVLLAMQKDFGDRVGKDVLHSMGTSYVSVEMNVKNTTIVALKEKFASRAAKRIEHDLSNLSVEVFRLDGGKDDLTVTLVVDVLFAHCSVVNDGQWVEDGQSVTDAMRAAGLTRRKQQESV